MPVLFFCTLTQRKWDVGVRAVQPALSVRGRGDEGFDVREFRDPFHRAKTRAADRRRRVGKPQCLFRPPPAQQREDESAAEDVPGTSGVHR